MNKTIEKFNIAWEKRVVNKPIIILIGGAAGTGKSSLAKKLHEDISYSNYLQTPIVRTLMEISNPKNEMIKGHTFDLISKDEKIKKSEYESELLKRYFQQCEPVDRTINKFLDFIASEKQHYIIEGSNILPDYKWKKSKEYLLLEIYLYVSDESQHKFMFSAPTHKRKLDPTRLKNLRIINSFIKNKAREFDKMTLNVNVDYQTILKKIGNKIEEFYKL